jgi:hypothetical protein
MSIIIDVILTRQVAMSIIIDVILTRQVASCNRPP